MHSVLRLSLWAAAAALLAMFGGVCLSLRGQSVADEAKKLLDQYDLAVALEAKESACRALDERKREVVADLVAGRLSFTEAAEAVYGAESATHGDFRMVRNAYSDLPDEEAAYCYVLDLVRRRPEGAPALPGLQAEYESRFHHPARLPRR